MSGAFSWFARLLSEFSHDLDGEDDIIKGAAAREVRNGEVEALEDGAGDMEAGDVLKGFVEDVAGIEVGDDEDIGVAGDGGVGEFLLGDGGIDGGVELHFAIEEDFGVLEFLTDGLHQINCVVVAAATKSRERKQGDAGWFGKELRGGGVGLVNNFHQLVFGGMLTGGHVSEEIDFGVFLHDGEAGESFARETKVVAAGEDDIAGGIINASDYGVGLTRFDHGAGALEVGGCESGDLGEAVLGDLGNGGAGGTQFSMAREGGLDSRIVEFWKYNVHMGIITYLYF